MAAWYTGEYDEWTDVKGKKSFGACVMLEPGTYDMSHLEHKTVKLDIFTTAVPVGGPNSWKRREGLTHLMTGQVGLGPFSY